MGEDISKSRFSRSDFDGFAERLRRETAVLKSWFEQGRFERTNGVGGLELETWLLDQDGHPAPDNQEFIKRLGSGLVCPELSMFNVEFNALPVALRRDALDRLEASLRQTWQQARQVTDDMGLKLMMVGILPTVGHDHLSLLHMSPLNRYYALDEQILRLREGQPIELDIRGKDHLRKQHSNVMLEAAATSFQIHLQINQDESARFYNAAKIASAPVVAAAANSPFLFGKELWDETRIPLFEQAISVGGSDYTERVTFGVRYAHDSIMEVFEANERYPVLLPLLFDEPAERLRHLTLHNGTIWRWNRTIAGFSPDGTPHLRLEQRVVPAGPTIPDSIANAAFFYGLVFALARGVEDMEARLPFETAHRNFYDAAKRGLDANMTWLDGVETAVDDLILDTLLPLAHQALDDLGLDADSVEHHLVNIQKRVAGKRNGARWQRAFANKCGGDMEKLCRAYFENQETGAPVHEWPL